MVSGGSLVQICLRASVVVATGVFVESAFEPIGATVGLATTVTSPTPTALADASVATAATVQLPGLGRPTRARWKPVRGLLGALSWKTSPAGNLYEVGWKGPGGPER